MERVLRREEEQLHLAESQLKLAQQAFDQFLQEKDRRAVEAQRRCVTLLAHEESGREDVACQGRGGSNSGSHSRVPPNFQGGLRGVDVIN